MSRETIKITVGGKVQGVFYRQSAREKAKELGITGKIMNMEDGTVHIIATGEPENLEIFFNWCHQGPPGAKVENAHQEKMEFQKFKNFEIERS